MVPQQGGRPCVCQNNEEILPDEHGVFVLTAIHWLCPLSHIIYHRNSACSTIHMGYVTYSAISHLHEKIVKSASESRLT